MQKLSLPAAESSSTSSTSPMWTARIFASRQSNTPAIRLSQGEMKSSSEDSTLPLDYNSPDLPKDTGAWLRNAGIDNVEAGTQALQALWQVWRDNDMLRLESRIGCEDNKVVLSDTVALADPFGTYRQPHLIALGDTSKTHPLETQAASAGLFYHKSRSGGDIGCYGYGAGSAMATMDVLATVGGKAANFLDGGGGATEANVKAALGLMLSDSDVKVVFVNSFGGLTKTDMIAAGIVDVLRERQKSGNPHPPFIVRLRGTGEKEAKQILENATDLKDVKYIANLKEAASAAADLAASLSPSKTSTSGPPRVQPIATLSPVLFSQDGQYDKTAKNMMVDEGARVVIMGTGKASQFHNGVAQKFGTNIVGACAPGKAGTEFLSKPVFGSLKDAQKELKPDIVSVFVPPKGAADAIIECIEAEIPLVVAYAEGVPTHDQLRIQAAIRSQGKSRLIGANCPGLIIPPKKVKLGIQPLAVHAPGIVGLASRSGTISYELASATTALGLGQSIVFGLGGDPFPGTRTHEALSLMLSDPLSKLICVVGEVGGQAEEEVAEVYRHYLASLRDGEVAKPVVGFIAGRSTERGLMYGHAGAIWWEDWETAESKKKCWSGAGIKVAETIEDVGNLLVQEGKRIGVI